MLLFLQQIKLNIKKFISQSIDFQFVRVTIFVYHFIRAPFAWDLMFRRSSCPPARMCESGFYLLNLCVLIYPVGMRFCGYVRFKRLSQTSSQKYLYIDRLKLYWNSQNASRWYTKSL